MEYNKIPIRFALVFLLSVTSAVATATSISLSPTQTGAITRTEIFTSNGPLPPTMSSSNPLESLGYSPASPVGMVKSRSKGQGYLLFDLSALPFSAETASLDFDLGYARSTAPNLTITSLLQVQNFLNIPSGTEFWSAQVFLTGTPEEQAAYNRLSSGYSAISNGSELGTLAASGPFNGIYSIDLNSEALGIINSGAGLFGLGITWTPTVDILYDPALDIDWEDGTDTLIFNAAPTLVLNRVSEVPLPATAWLFLSAVGGLGLFKRRWHPGL